MLYNQHIYTLRMRKELISSIYLQKAYSKINDPKINFTLIISYLSFALILLIINFLVANKSMRYGPFGYGHVYVPM